ncbi:MAG TPA: FUSC family protein [Polyangia bacterium]|jgi:hypothetical protein|nr:FUSC family protein [Polyangia bacterium]
MSSVAGTWSHVRAAGSRARRGVAADMARLLQATAAATAAWVIAKHVVHHHEPFFAPIAAAIALNTSIGQRGLNAVRMILGVFVGIAVGEGAIWILGGGYGTLTLATFVAMAVARALGGARIVIAQAAASAILTVAVTTPEAGLNRMADALIGGGVALLFSQVLFSPEPIAFLRRGEAAALEEMKEAMHMTVRALERDDPASAEQAARKLRDLRDQLSDLGHLRHQSTAVARHSLLWRSHLRPLAGEADRVAYLDLLGSSCLVLTRIGMALDHADRGLVAPSVRDLAATLAELATDPGDRETRQRAGTRALAVARGLGSEGEPARLLTAARTGVWMVAFDIMTFTGVLPDAASRERR